MQQSYTVEYRSLYLLWLYSSAKLYQNQQINLRLISGQ